MKKELYFDTHSGLQVAALAEDGRLVELVVENESNKDIVGNIYKGKVVNVIESMNAAFVACGLERNCYLSLSGETMVDPSKYDGKAGKRRTAAPTVKEGDEVIVQVLKNPRGTKGAKVTTKLSFVGKNLIFLPGTDFLGISRKIQETELRDNLLFAVDGMRRRGDGLIIRTAAPYAPMPRLQAEVKYLKNLYRDVLEKLATAEVGDVLYREFELPVRMLRDSFDEDIARIFVGEKGMYDRLVSLVRMRLDFNVKDIELYEGERDMLSRYGIFSQIEELSSAQVPLPNGANLVIERTEAMTVVDVNTGHFLGDENLEDTVYATNIAAAREIARQVRLRDIGGIVVVDFIDMVDPQHRRTVTEELTQSLSFDRSRCKVLPMNELCLVEFTRKRMTNGVRSALLTPCAHCKQSGYIFSNEFICCLIRAQILEQLSRSVRCVLVEMNRSVMEFLFKGKKLAKDLERYADREVYFVPHRTYHEQYFTVKGFSSAREAHLPPDAVKMI